jgi:hypothetical protein
VASAIGLKLADKQRREIAESVVSGRKSGAEMARLYGVSEPTVSRIVASLPRTGKALKSNQRRLSRTSMNCSAIGRALPQVSQPFGCGTSKGEDKAEPIFSRSHSNSAGSF